MRREDKDVVLARFDLAAIFELVENTLDEIALFRELLVPSMQSASAALWQDDGRSTGH